MEGGVGGLESIGAAQHLYRRKWRQHGVAKSNSINKRHGSGGSGVYQ